MIRIPAAGKQNLIPGGGPVRLSNGFAEVSQTSPLFLRSNNIHNIQREASNDFQQFSNARSAFNAQHPTIPMDQPNSIKNWAEDDRPREKLLHKGPAALADAELLAILINTGTTKYSALDLAREVLKKADGRLSDLGRLSLKELQQVHGIGEAKAHYDSRRTGAGPPPPKRRRTEPAAITSMEDAAEIILPLLNDLNHEAFCVLYLNQANKLLRHEIISTAALPAPWPTSASS